MDQAAWATRIRAQMAFEFAREAPPEGFPGLAPIPTGRYTDPAFYALEREHIWRKSWLLVGREEEFEGRGSFKTFQRTGAPLLIIRGSDGVLRGFFNTCQHRGAPVVREACGIARRLQCQYHSWTYDLEGELVGVPDRRDFTDLDESQRNLKPIRCEVYEGWVFVNEDLDAQPLRAWLGPVADEWSVLHGSELRAVGRRQERVPCNWKIAADAFLETYHVKTIHPHSVAKLLDHRGAAMGLFANGHSRMVTPKWEEAVWKPGGGAKPPIEEIEGLDPLFAETNPAYSLFPNLITPLDTIGFPFICFWPVDAETTDIEWIFYGLPPRNDEQEAFWQRYVESFDLVMGEDFMNLAPMHRSVASGALESIPLNYQERRIYHLHEEVDRLIGPERIPEALRVVPRLEPFWETRSEQGAEA